MADDKDDAVEGEEGGKKKSKLKLIIIAVVALLVLGGGGAAAYFMFLAPDESAEGEEEVAEAVEAAPVERQEAVYTKIRSKEGRPMFVVPLRSQETLGKGRGHYMQVYVEAKSRDQLVHDTLTLHMPVVVARLNGLFAAQEFETLQTKAGRDKLRQDSVDNIREFMIEKIGKPGIETILFTNFVMQ
ncbi:MAG: flagellar basal body-associated FliL family protein [Pontibacterium sp.]